MVTLALIWKEPFPLPVNLLWGGLSRGVGGLGLLALYLALSRGKMGIAAPVSAVLAAILPVLFGLFTTGLPTPLQLLGFVLALLAIGLISRPEGSAEPESGLGLAVLAGCGFGCSKILISRVHPGAIFWPVAAARFTAVLVLLIMLRLQRQQILPGKAVASLMMLTGSLSALGGPFLCSPARVVVWMLPRSFLPSIRRARCCWRHSCCASASPASRLSGCCWRSWPFL